MSGTGLRQAALSGARWTVAARIGLQLITWPVTILVMRLLEPRDYGLFAMAIVVTGFITLFSELGLGAALVQAEVVDEDTARSACAAIWTLNAVVALALIALAPWAADWFGEPELAAVMQVLTLELVISAFAAVPEAMLERRLAFRPLSLVQVAAGVSGSAVTLGVALLGGDAWSLVAGSLTLAGVRSVLLIRFHGRMIWPSWRKGLTPILPMVRFSSHVIGARALWYWYGQADQVILARLLHASLLGYYNVASQLAMLPANKAMEIVNRVAFPILSRLHGDREAFQGAHRRTVGLVGAYAFSVCWGLASVAEEFVALALGAKWLPAAVPLALLALTAPLRMLSALNNTIVTAAGAPQAATKELSFACVVVPSAVFAGVWAGGIVGAALAWLLVFPAVYLLSNALTCAAIGARMRDGLRPLAAPMGAGLVMLAAIWFVRVQVGSAHGLPLLLAAEIAAGALAFLASLRLLAPALLRDARTLLRDVLRPRRDAD